VPNAPCNFIPSLTTCESSNNTITLRTYDYGDNSRCTYIWNITWGDGHTTSDVVQKDPPDGYNLLAGHSYVAPGKYTITDIGKVTAGTCQVASGTHTFTLPDVTSPQPKHHSVTLIGTVSCHGAGNGPLTVGRIRIQAANGEAHDADVHLAWTYVLTTYSVKFTRVPQGGESAYVYVTCGFYDPAGHFYGTVYGLKGPIHLDSIAGYQWQSISPGEKP
jgi:hypothetical protein